MAAQTSHRDHETLFVSLALYRLDPHGSRIDPVDPVVAHQVEPSWARRAHVLPWLEHEGVTFVAVTPSSLESSSVVLESSTIRLTMTTEADLISAQDRVYGLENPMPDETVGGILLSSGHIRADAIVDVMHDQALSGTRIGDLLSSRNHTNFWAIAEALAVQQHRPAIDLDQVSLDGLDPVWHALDDSYWLRRLVVPLDLSPARLVVAMVDPYDRKTMIELEKHFGCPVEVWVTGYRDVLKAFKVRFESLHTALSREALMDRAPELSAHFLLSRSQRGVLILLSLLATLGMTFNWIATLSVLNAIVEVVYTANAVYRLWLVFLSRQYTSGGFVRGGRRAALDAQSLPIYTILVPLYQEASVLPTLAEAIQNLEYPKHLLDVKFLLEADDVATIHAARESHLPNYISLVIIPPVEPRTKPKACNYGLLQARGEYVVIFDAEDIPEPDQLLKAIEVFRSSDDHMACVQAKLSYFNSRQNLLTRWFTSEYAMWFDQMLPALFARDLPMPLGGTSNHFRIDVLREIGAWDPFNVTEDADLGVRLYRAGYRTVVMESTTYEEANSDFVNWIRQRSRWVKGYIQTWLVHMRNPRHLYREVKGPGFLAFHAIIGGTPLTFLVNPFLWALTSTWFVLGVPFAHKIFPSWVYYTAFLNLAIGNFAFMYTNVTGMALRRDWHLVKFATITPIYWTFMSIAGWKGFLQLLTRPFYWEKTVHGLTSMRAPIEKSHETS